MHEQNAKNEPLDSLEFQDEEREKNNTHSRNDDKHCEKKKPVSITGKTVYRVKMVHSSATEFCISEDNAAFTPGDHVILSSKYGRDLAKIQGVISHLEEVDREEVIVISRKACPKDMRKYEENIEKDKKAFEICKQKALEHNLDMKLVSAHHLLDESKILFFFTADARVDFRELVKDLVAIFRTRIELRQIGVRDESRVLGGMGMCGRGFCCNTITDHLKPVSIKMAKEQNLSLNSLKISGACGRLLCCLAYEYPFYKEQKASLPPQGAKINLGADEFVVNEINVFIKKILLRSKTEQVALDFDKFYFDDSKSRWCVKDFHIVPEK